MADDANSSSAASMVESNISTVEAAYSYALEQNGPNGGIFSTPNPSAYDAIQNDRSGIDAWEQAGRTAAANNTTPGVNGWSGWIQAGQAWIDGFPGIGVAGEVSFELDDAVSNAISSVASVTSALAGNPSVAAADGASSITSGVGSVSATVSKIGSSVATAAAGLGGSLKWIGIGAVVIVVGMVALKYGPKG